MGESVSRLLFIVYCSLTAYFILITTSTANILNSNKIVISHNKIGIALQIRDWHPLFIPKIIRYYITTELLKLHY